MDDLLENAEEDRNGYNEYVKRQNKRPYKYKRPREMIDPREYLKMKKISIEKFNHSVDPIKEFKKDIRTKNKQKLLEQMCS